VYQTVRTFTNSSQVLLKNMHTGQERLLTASYHDGGPANDNSTAPQISPDGRYIVFTSTAGDLVPNDTNNTADIFVYDRTAGSLLLVSANRQGTGSANDLSFKPLMSADGRTVLFESFAGDLIEGDYNDAGDVFVLRLGAGDTDHDGLPDDWEVAYFGDLSHDGAGDSDGDGLSDRQEYLAGTDPTNQGSVLRVLTVSPASGGPVTLLWSAVPGKTYQVQFKDQLADSWTDLAGPITVTSLAGTARDPSGPAQRFYRVLLAQ
jgi:dipeptidyl aminopeptidase/acylaminoacyl peptidase